MLVYNVGMTGYAPFVLVRAPGCAAEVDCVAAYYY
jgi:hypothetical protein